MIDLNDIKKKRISNVEAFIINTTIGLKCYSVIDNPNWLYYIKDGLYYYAYSQIAKQLNYSDELISKELSKSDLTLNQCHSLMREILSNILNVDININMMIETYFTEYRTLDEFKLKTTY